MSEAPAQRQHITCSTAPARYRACQLSDLCNGSVETCIRASPDCEKGTVRLLLVKTSSSSQV